MKILFFLHDKSFFVLYTNDEGEYLMNILNSIMLGVGLAMDAFSVSIANGLKEPAMKRTRMCTIASVYAGFQFLMPLIGWVCVSKIVEYFNIFEKYIPWIAFFLLLYIGGKMLIEGISDYLKEKKERSLGLSEEDIEREEKERILEKSGDKNLTVGLLLLQGVATSIDALSVGFTIAHYNFKDALGSCVIIAIVTFIICFFGLKMGKKIGAKISGKATVLGGVILLLIGIQILIKSFIG